MYKKSKKFFRKNKQEFISALSVFSLILNLSFPLVAYAETTITTTPTTEETETVVEEEEVAIDEESTEGESTSEEETTSEESTTGEEVTDDETNTTVAEEEVISEEESTEEVTTEEETTTTETTEQTTEEETTTTQTQETTTPTEETNNNEENNEEEESEEDLTGMECLAEDADTSVSADSDWEIDGDVAETKDDVVLGVRYEFPLNHDVSVTFNCLPKDELLRSHLIIEQIDIDDLNLPEGFETDAENAYDITTEMENGEFEYEITLPNWGDEDSEIAYVEKSADEVKREGVSEEDVKNVEGEERDGSKVKAKGDHFTIFIPISASSGQPAIDLDHCANGTASSPTQCLGGAWEDGNLVASKAHYLEGDTVPYRAVLKQLVAGQTYSMTIEWDTTKGGKHALDYLTTYNRTETDADPCSDIYSNCGDGPAKNFLIPPDLFMQSDSNWVGSQIPGEFTIYNGTINSLSSYNTPANYNGDTSTSISVNFTADQNDWVVIAWGGHISTREDWGQENSAINISGSPYHTRFADFTCNASGVNCNTGQQDHQLAAGAVIFPASVTVVKEANPEGSQQFGFTGDLGNFSLVDDSTLSNTITFSDIIDFKNSYSITETVPTGWTLDNITCEDPTQDSTISGNTATVSLDEGENVTCTFNNSQQEAYLTVNKVVVNDDGGTLGISDFPLFIDQTQVTSGDVNALSPGTYTVSETNQPGYSATISGNCLENGQITLADGESKTCTITNDDIVPNLTLIKEVTNDDGGEALPTEWTLEASWNNGDNGFSGTTPVNSDVEAGVPIILSESNGPIGYENEGWECDGGTLNGNQVTLGLSEDVTCTVTNNDITASITLIKNVTNDSGGQATINQFGLQIGDTYVDSGQTLEVASNTPIALDEDGLAGYDFVSITGDPECPSELGGTVSLDPGQDITCTINNDDIAPTLTLVKEVTNNNGGDADPEDWTLFATDGDSSFNGKSGVSAQVKANEPIILSESSILNGYENEGWECDGGTLVENQITLGLDEDVTCTVTNNDISPQLTVIKIVDNDDGGLLNPGDFTINVTGDNVSDPSFPGDNQGTTVTLNAGSYNVTEELIDGYTPQYSEDCDGTIGLGESKTCTITNSDEAPTLTLIKKVENDNGGSRQVSDFQLYIGDIPVESGDSTQLEANVLYTVSEDNLEGYQASDWGGDCSAGGTITLEPGQDAECTITNDDVGPLLKLRKVVINEYDEEVADASEWTLGAIDNDCGTVDEAENCGFTDSGDSTTFHEVLAGEQYTLFETGGPDTYEQGPLGWRCDTSGVRTLNTVSLSPGDQVTCTIINYAIAPTLTITKIVEGGDAEVSDFNLFANRFGFNSGVPQEVNAGTYQVRETTNVEGYTGVFGGDCNEQGIVKVDIAEDKECTITNTRDTGTITILKNIDWDESGEIGDHPNDVLGSEAWTWDISGGEKDIATGSSRELNTDTYTITEDLQDNYHLVGWVCTDQSQGANNSISIDLDKDEDITCTFTNAPDTGLISGYKYNDLDGDGTIEEGEPPYSFWRIELYDDEDNLVDFQLTDVEGYYAFTDLVPGTYHLEEEQLVGYVQTVPGPDQGIGPIEITPGDESTGNIFGNFELITISGYKYNDLNANGERDLEEPGLSGWTINLSGSDTDSDITVESGYFEFTGLGPGTYNLQESQQEGWQQTDGNEGYEVVAQSGQDAVEGILFGNAQLTDIHGYKWLDGNANGIRDCYYPQLEDEIVRTIGDELPEPVCEEFLSGWTIFIDENDNQQLDEGEPNMETDSSEEELGWYWFEDLLPGTYSICEVQQAGWAQTHPTETQCHTITVPGNCFIYDDVSPTVGVSATAQQFPTQNYVFACEYNFGNVPVNPELLISKSNDTGGTDQEIGDLVEYTITVRVEESDVNEVTVTDLLPEGFVYQSGSWTADSDVRGDLKGLGTTPEPTYASPGTWQLGDMEAGETVTLTYIAKIQNSVDEGLYKDLAWANGDDVLENNVTASSESPGVVNDTFVGTEVNVISDDPFTDEAEVEEEEVIEEEVLGAATFLPATGSDTGLLYAGIMILVIGLISLLAGVNMLGKEKTINYLKATLRPFVITVFLLLAMSSVSHAGSLAVRVEEPEANANSSFATTFVALDQENLEVSAQCYVKKPGAGSFTAFGPVINLGAGGDTDECQVGNSVLTSEGTYVFKVEASTSEETLDSDEVTVDYDGDGPERPKYIEKDRTSSCTYDIKVQTHADGNTSYIEVYADDDKDIEVNAGSRIKTINIGPDEEVEFEHEVYGPDCAETFYFATVAFDSADNPSKVRVEVIEDVVTKTTTIDEGTTQEQGAIPVSDEGGSILGLGDEESTTEEEATTDEDGQVLGEGDEETDFGSQTDDGQTRGLLSRVADNWPWLLVAILVLLLGNAIRKRRNRS